MYYLPVIFRCFENKPQKTVQSIMKNIMFLEDLNIKKVESDPNPHLQKSDK